MVIDAAQNAGDQTMQIPAAGVPCWIYMGAVQNMSVIANQSGRRLLGICAPDSGRLLDFIRIFVQYANNSRDNESGNAAALGSAR